MSARIGDCPRCESALERGDLRCAVCAHIVPTGAVDAPVATLEVLRCTGCGAALAYDAREQAPRCVFCESVLRLETLVDPVEQAEGYLPFTVSEEEAERALRSWQGGLGWFRPGDLRAASRITELQPLWWVAWVFDARVTVSWTADSDADSGISGWAPHAGQAALGMEGIFASASRGLSEQEADFLAPSYDLSSGRDRPQGLARATLQAARVEQFDVQRSTARRRVLEALVEDLTERVQAEHVPGRRHRNVHVEPLLRDLETRRLAAPVYVLVYRYHGELHRVLISGQDAGFVCGTAPYSGWRILGVVVGVLVSMALLVLVLLSALA